MALAVDICLGVACFRRVFAVRDACRLRRSENDILTGWRDVSEQGDSPPIAKFLQRPELFQDFLHKSVRRLRILDAIERDRFADALPFDSVARKTFYLTERTNPQQAVVFQTRQRINKRCWVLRRFQHPADLVLREKVAPCGRTCKQHWIHFPAVFRVTIEERHANVIKMTEKNQRPARFTETFDFSIDEL